MSAAVTLLSTTPPAWAAESSQSALFQPNPLTNGFLEQIRIWEQAEADNLKYGGELARGDAGNKGQVSAYPRLLVPILVVAQELGAVSRAVQTGGPTTQYAEALQILRQSKYEKVEFKRVFNAFADNIYYADPDRANLYLAGGGACVPHDGLLRATSIPLHVSLYFLMCFDSNTKVRAIVGILAAQRNLDRH